MVAKEFIKECIRVLKITQKPNKQEFKKVVLVSSVGIALIGLLGFIILYIYETIF